MCKLDAHSPLGSVRSMYLTGKFCNCRASTAFGTVFRSIYTSMLFLMAVSKIVCAVSDVSGDGSRHFLTLGLMKVAV